MKRSAFDVLRRGFDNLLANWPLILIRLAESMVILGLIVGSIVAAVIPIVVSAGMSNLDIRNPESAAQWFGELLIEHWIIVVYLLALLTVLLTVIIAVHSFVEAGSARIYIDGERRAAQTPAAPRDSFRAFAVDRWLRGGWSGWWTVFWIYNLAWGVGGLVLLLPALLTLVAMFLVPATMARVAVGCGGLVLCVLVMVPTAVLIGIWTEKAVAVCVARSLGAVDALRASRREVKLDFARHLGVALIVIVVSFMAAGVFSGLSVPFSFGNRSRDIFTLMFAPMRVVLSVLQSGVSAAISGWFLASFVGLTEER